MALLGIVSLVASIVSVVCLVLVLLKLFPDKGVGWGIFGIFCGIYTFIWGWQNKDQYNLQQIMLIWTGAIVANIVLRVAVMTMAGSARGGI